MKKQTIGKLVLLVALLTLALSVCVAASAVEDHIWVQDSKVQDANCDHPAQYKYVCSICGASKLEYVGATDPNAHSWGPWQTTKPATCSVAGEEIRTCANNVHHTQTREVPATGHKWSDWETVTAATCENPGQERRTCSVCHDTETRTIPALDHLWGPWQDDVKPTCEAAGTQVRICSRDSSHKETQTVPALGHDWAAWKVVTEATCTATGLEERICNRDSSHKQQQTLPAMGHDWGPWHVTKEPTLTEEGEEQRECSRKDATETRKLGVKMMYNNTMCAFGPRVKDTDLTPYNDTVWYMFTPFDASADGKQVYELVVSDMFIVGDLTIDIRNGNITVDYDLNSRKIQVKLEFFTILNKISDLQGVYMPESLKAFSMQPGRAYNMQENWGDDTNLVLYFCSRVDYQYDSSFRSLQYLSAAHQKLLKQMLSIMDPTWT